MNVNLDTLRSLPAPATVNAFIELLKDTHASLQNGGSLAFVLAARTVLRGGQLWAVFDGVGTPIQYVLRVSDGEYLTVEGMRSTSQVFRHIKTLDKYAGPFCARETFLHSTPHGRQVDSMLQLQTKMCGIIRRWLKTSVP